MTKVLCLTSEAMCLAFTWALCHYGMNMQAFMAANLGLLFGAQAYIEMRKEAGTWI